MTKAETNSRLLSWCDAKLFGILFSALSAERCQNILENNYVYFCENAQNSPSSLVLSFFFLFPQHAQADMQVFIMFVCWHVQVYVALCVGSLCPGVRDLLQ